MSVPDPDVATVVVALERHAENAERAAAELVAVVEKLKAALGDQPKPPASPIRDDYMRPPRFS